MEVKFQEEQSSKAKVQQDMDALKMFYESKLSDVDNKKLARGKSCLINKLYELFKFVCASVLPELLPL